jgi:hypothetical protein
VNEKKKKSDFRNGYGADGGEIHLLKKNLLPSVVGAVRHARASSYYYYYINVASRVRSYRCTRTRHEYTTNSVLSPRPVVVFCDSQYVTRSVDRPPRVIHRRTHVHT